MSTNETCVANDAIFETGFNLLIQILNNLSTEGNLTHADKINQAIEISRELYTTWQTLRTQAQHALVRQNTTVSDCDPTNYEMYKLLHSFGLTTPQLLEITKVEKLHELRVLRVLRTVYGLGLDDARRTIELSGY